MRSIINFFIKHPTWSTVIKIIVLGYGLLAVLNMQSSFFPEIERRVINIQVTYPGASPLEIEKGIVLKIEDNLKGVEGIERYTSKSRENTASITIESLKGYDVDEVLQDVKNAVDRINSFPAGMEPVVVFKQPTLEFAISFSVAGDVDLKTLKTIAREVEDDMRGMDGISQIELSGFPDEEIVIDLDEEELRRYGLNFDMVASAVRMENRDISAGSIKTQDEEIRIRYEGKNYFAEELTDIVVKSEPDGKVVLLRDIADVRNDWAEDPQMTFVNGKRSVIVNVNKLLGEDILEITEKVRVYVDDFNKTHETLEAKVLDDRTKSLSKRLDMLIWNGFLGMLLVMISLAIFLNIRLAFWVALAIPFSFLGMFLVAYIYGITINVITLFGCILVVGILVDDGIVIAEQIFQNYEQGKKPFKAALEGTLQVLPSVFFATITTIAAFMPFFFLEGSQGENMRDMGIVVIITLLFSLIEAALILPAHLAHSKALRNVRKQSRFRLWLDRALEYPRDVLYSKSLLFFLKHKILIVALAFFMTFVTIGAISGGVIGFTFFPYIDRDAFEISLELPAGTREQETLEVLNRIEKAAWEVNDEIERNNGEKDMIQKVIKKTAIGPTGLWGSVTQAGANVGTIKIILLGEDDREMESFKVANLIRKKVGTIYEAEKLTYGTGSRFGKPVSVPLISPNFDELDGARKELKDRLNELRELDDVSDNSPAGLREFKIKPKKKAYLLGLNARDIAWQVRQGFFGEEVQRLQRGEDEVRVWVRYTGEVRSSIEKFEDMRIRINNVEYPLGDLVEYSIERGTEVINHLNGKREITVEADMVDQNAEVPPIINRVQNEILPEILAKYPSVETAESGQKREIMKTARSSQRALPIAFVIMYFLIVLSFRSFTQAAIVITLIPLGIIGAIWGHYLMGMPVNMMSAYGVIALIGIIVNDSIVFINTANEHFVAGESFETALFKTGINRFRPILLTTVTTVFGLLPLLAETSRQAQFLIPMAISVAFGLIVASLGTLVFLPVYMGILSRMKVLMKWLWTGSKPTREELEPAVREARKIKEYDK